MADGLQFTVSQRQAEFVFQVGFGCAARLAVRNDGIRDDADAIPVLVLFAPVGKIFPRICYRSGVFCKIATKARHNIPVR